MFLVIRNKGDGRVVIKVAEIEIKWQIERRGIPVCNRDVYCLPNLFSTLIVIDPLSYNLAPRRTIFSSVAYS